MNQLDDFIAISSALADPNRVRALLALRGGELCACQIIELLQLAPSTVSRHMAVLRQAGLVEVRKEGRWMYFRLPDESASPLVRSALEWTRQALARDVQARQDVKTLCCIVKEDPEELWKKQAKRSKCCSSAQETRVEVRWRKGGLAV